jgi:hypothetical protein
MSWTDPSLSSEMMKGKSLYVKTTWVKDILFIRDPVCMGLWLNPNRNEEKTTATVTMRVTRLVVLRGGEAKLIKGIINCTK